MILRNHQSDKKLISEMSEDANTTYMLKFEEIDKTLHLFVDQISKIIAAYPLVTKPSLVQNWAVPEGKNKKFIFPLFLNEIISRKVHLLIFCGYLKSFEDCGSTYFFYKYRSR